MKKITELIFIHNKVKSLKFNFFKIPKQTPFPWERAGDRKIIKYTNTQIHDSTIKQLHDSTIQQLNASTTYEISNTKSFKSFSNH